MENDRLWAPLQLWTPRQLWVSAEAAGRLGDPGRTGVAVTAVRRSNVAAGGRQRVVDTDGQHRCSCGHRTNWGDIVVAALTDNSRVKLDATRV